MTEPVARARAIRDAPARGMPGHGRCVVIMMFVPVRAEPGRIPAFIRLMPAAAPLTAMMTTGAALQTPLLEQAVF